jgi:hypothetical protein
MALSVEYDPLVISLISRSDAVSFNELTDLLLTHEQHLQKHNLVVAGASSPSFLAYLSLSTSTFSGMS